MPTLNSAVELLTGFVYAIVVILIVDWPRQTIAEHAFGERRESINGVVLQEFCGGGRIAFRHWKVWVGWSSKLVEFEFG